MENSFTGNKFTMWCPHCDRHTLHTQQDGSFVQRIWKWLTTIRAIQPILCSVCGLGYGHPAQSENGHANQSDKTVRWDDIRPSAPTRPSARMT